MVTVPRLSAGVITADLTRLGAELEILRGTAAWAHVDVMDGAFCPQLTVGPAFVAAVASTGLPVDAHLMVEEPRRLVPDIAAAGASVITVHAEATRHLHRTLQEMTQLAGEPRSFLRGVAINPGTPVQAVEPVLELADLILVLAVNPGWSGQSPRPAPAAGSRPSASSPPRPAPTCWSAWTAGSAWPTRPRWLAGTSTSWSAAARSSTRAARLIRAPARLTTLKSSPRHCSTPSLRVRSGS